MKILAGLIRREVQLQANEYGHCALYEDELQRVWPLNEENRKAKIEQFANENGFRLPPASIRPHARARAWGRIEAGGRRNPFSLANCSIFALRFSSFSGQTRCNSSS